MKLRIFSLILGFIGFAVWVFSMTKNWNFFGIFTDYNYFMRHVELMHYNLLSPLFYILFGISTFFGARSIALAVSGINAVLSSVHISYFFVAGTTYEYFIVAFPPAVISFLCFGISIYLIIKNRKKKNNIDV